MSTKAERLVNLTVALLEARRPLTLPEIRARTGAYGQDDPESARRMFERDKDDLRRLGVPVETRGVDAFEAELGYIIDRRAYELPDVDLDPDEVAALALALQVSGHGRERLALAKLVARAPDPPGDLDAPPARVELGVDPVDQLAEAVVARRPVRFRYRAASGELSQRTLDAYAVAQRRGNWYVVGRDHDREELRAFRLDRIVGRVEPAGDRGGFEPPADLDVGALLGGSDEVDVEVAVAPDQRWDAELRGGRDTGRRHHGWPVYRFPAANPWQLGAWVAGLGPDAELLTPPELRARVLRRLRAAGKRRR